jgi:hypothetical protein
MCHSFSTDSKSTANIRDVVEMGCGYGTFTLPVALRISGVLTTFGQ